MPITTAKTVSLLLLVLFLTAACAHPYVEPTTGPRAMLRFISLKAADSSDVFVYSLTDENCKGQRQLIAALSGPAPKHFRKRMDMPLGENYADQDITEVAIKADQPYFFDFYWWSANLTAGMRNCNVTTAFNPVDGHLYEATFTLGRNNCAVDIFEIVKEVKKEVKEDTAVQENTAVEGETAVKEDTAVQEDKVERADKEDSGKFHRQIELSAIRTGAQCKW